MGKLSSVVEMLEEKKMDGFIVTDASNRKYLTNFTGGNGILLITKQGTVMITDYRYVEQAKEQTEGIEIILHSDHTGHKGSKSTIYKKVVEQINRFKLEKIGFEQDSMIFGLYNILKDEGTFELIPTLDIIEDIRMVKSESELKKLKTATEIADAAFLHILDIIKPGMKEIEISKEIGAFIEKHAAHNTGFLPIVASGWRGALAHGRASDKVIEQGDMIVLDFGANYEGYWSDMTRSISVGTPDPELEKIHGIVYEALEKTLEALKPGVYDQELDQIIKDHIRSQGYIEYAGTGTGHGIGMDVHEIPYLSTKKDKKVTTNMVFAIEPGIYLPGKGGVRIEDNLLVTEQGYENWNKSSKELFVL